MAQRELTPLEELFAPQDPAYSADGMIPDDGPAYNLEGIPPNEPVNIPSPRSRMYIGQRGRPEDEFGVPLMDDGTAAPQGSFVSNGQSMPPLEPLNIFPDEVRSRAIEGDKVRAAQQYANEIDSANRFYHRPDQYDPSGHLLPPKGQGGKPQYLKSGNDWYSVGADGKARLAVDAPDAQTSWMDQSQADALKKKGISPDRELVEGPPGRFKLERKKEKSDLEEKLKKWLSGGVEFSGTGSAPEASPSSGKKIRVKTSDGTTGTMSSNDPLPKGWVIIEK